MDEGRTCHAVSGASRAKPEYTVGFRILVRSSAVLAFDSPIDQIGAAWNSLMRDWLPDSGFQFDARPCFEYYPVDAVYDPVTCSMRCDICIPVAPL